uniref:Uncharacterized protein n=1 Tax=Timema tahoe TaxID=61484 RepID=A0A7R9IDT9_9NEOP|nr:unnamed protein product [Timema tahoe]
MLTLLNMDVGQLYTQVFAYSVISSPDRGLNLDLPVLGSLVQHETSALANYAAEELGRLNIKEVNPHLRGERVENNFGKNLGSPKRDPTSYLPVLCILAQHETSALANYATEERPLDTLGRSALKASATEKERTDPQPPAATWKPSKGGKDARQLRAANYATFRDLEPPLNTPSLTPPLNAPPTPSSPLQVTTVAHGPPTIPGGRQLQTPKMDPRRTHSRSLIDSKLQAKLLALLSLEQLMALVEHMQRLQIRQTVGCGRRPQQQHLTSQATNIECIFKLIVAKKQHREHLASLANTLTKITDISGADASLIDVDFEGSTMDLRSGKTFSALISPSTSEFEPSPLTRSQRISKFTESNTGGMPREDSQQVLALLEEMSQMLNLNQECFRQLEARVDQLAHSQPVP